MTTPNYAIAAATRDKLGESPVWNAVEQAVYWVDWYGPVIHRLHAPSGRLDHWTVPNTTMIGSIVQAKAGRLLLAIDPGLTYFDPRTGAYEPFCDPNGGREGVSYNDAKVDRFGRCWVGTFDVAEAEPRGILYCVLPDGAWTVADSGFAVCNGPAFSPDGLTLYFSDSVGRRILAYDVMASDCRLRNRRLFAGFGEADGVPDGLTVDARGDIWCAHYGAGRITRFAADGAVKDTLALSCELTTSCCFGGAGLKTLYVTTGVSTAEPGGALLALAVDAVGLAELEF
jgi:sugar lactone lactonase YvrE